MKKIIIISTILLILTILVSCSNNNSKNSEGIVDQVQQLNNEKYSADNFKVLITDNAINKMRNELSKNSSVGKTYSVKYFYASSG